ncbi:MAG TPA: archaetidylserine decarboxylase [Acetobacteraceae bacterium]|jgi:phosphatidylserine decarboxylase|nr:archaetidylserine decarboxylase [Acetobacteraceae bacterium]
MKMLRSAIAKITQQEDINFLLTNRIPRRLATRFFGWFSQLEHPLIRDLSIGAWRLFSDLDLSDARDNRFRSLHDCFVRRLRDGARQIDADPELLVSPCDAIVGASGAVQGDKVLQIKGFPYRIQDLLGDDEHAALYRNGRYVTLRLTSTMYHHFHAPHDCRVESVTYISGDTWNVNPIALKRIERLFCRNERAPIRIRLSRTGHAITLVPVAAILVAGIRLSFLAANLDIRRGGTRTVPLDVPLSKGDEMGWFQHGSTIIVFAPDGFVLSEGVREGSRIRVGQPLMRLPCRPEVHCSETERSHNCKRNARRS